MKIQPAKLLLRGLLAVPALVLSSVPSFAAPTTDSVPVDLRVELDRATLPANSAETAIIKITLVPGLLPQPEERPPLNLALVLDKSGSMGGEKLEQTKVAARQIIERLGSEDRLTVIAYDSRPQVLVSARAVERQDVFLRAIDGLAAGGSTALYGGVQLGANQIEALSKELREAGHDRIILLSDGLANVGPQTSEDFSSLGDALSSRGFVISTIGVGLDYSEDIMTTLALSSQGNTYFVENARRIPEILDEEMRDATSVVASNLRIELEVQPGFKPLRVMGRKATITGQRVSVPVRQLYSGAERYALIEVEVDSLAEQQEISVAEIEVHYDNVQAKPQQVSTRLNAAVVADEAVVKASANEAVLAQVALHERIEAQQAAVRYNDAGEYEKASGALKQARRKILGLSLRSAAPAPALMQEAAIAEEQADAFSSELDSRSRKQVQTENTAVQNQQRGSYRP